MGTRFEIVLHADDRELDDSALRAAAEAAIDEIRCWHHRLNRFAPDSLVSHLNRSARQPVRLDRETFDLFADALEVHRASSGAFDVTVTPILVRQGARDSAVPTGGRGETGQGFELDPHARTIRMSGERLSLDLGGIAKGHALDCAAACLREAGVSSALLHGGTSSVLAIGRARRHHGWRVALGGGPAGIIVTLDDASLSLSDPAGQAAVTGRTHILDPRAWRDRTSMPASRVGGRVAVTGASARVTDAWSTALAVLGHVPSSFPAAYAATFLDRRRDGGRTDALAAS